GKGLKNISQFDPLHRLSNMIVDNTETYLHEPATRASVKDCAKVLADCTIENRALVKQEEDGMVNLSPNQSTRLQRSLQEQQERIRYDIKTATAELNGLRRRLTTVNTAIACLGNAKE